MRNLPTEHELVLGLASGIHRYESQKPRCLLAPLGVQAGGFEFHSALQLIQKEIHARNIKILPQSIIVSAAKIAASSRPNTSLC